MQKRALVVDDSRVARMSLKKAIISHEFDVAEFASAEEVLAYLETTTDKPTIIFMDLMMDGMDGLTATKQIKMMAGFTDIPVVICSGNSAEIDLNSAKAAGAMEILSKPPEQSAVANILQQITERMSTEVSQIHAEKSVPTVDNSIVTEKVVELIEQKILLKMEKDFSQLAEQISRRTVTEAIENSLPEKVQKSLNDLMPTISQQLISDTLQANQQAIQSATEQVVTQVIEQRLPQAIESATAEINLNQQMDKWLSEQETIVQQRIAKEVQLDVTGAVEHYIDSSLATMIAPLVTLQVEQELQKQSGAANEPLQALEARISKLDRIIMGLGLAVIILAIMLLI